MLLNENLDRLLENFFKQWNIAERRIKKAEQVRGNEVVASAIFELRYAGRKLVDAFEIARTADWENDDVARDRIHRYLADGMEDCVKAKHDAIDATLDFVTRWFQNTENSLGLDRLQQYFPDYLEKTSRIHQIQEQIANSRGARLDRDQIYDAVEENDFDEILELFSRMLLSRERVEAATKDARKKERARVWLTIGGIVVGIVGIAIAIFG